MSVSASSSDHPPASAADAPDAILTPRPPKRRARWWLALALLAAAGGALFALRGGEVPSSPPQADVPRLEQGRIVFSAGFRERVGLATKPVRSSSLTPTVAAVGMVTFDPRHTARVGTRLRGVVRSLHAYEGDEVTRGQLLAEINSPELGEAQAQVTMLVAQVQAAVRQAARETALAQQSLATAREAEQAEAERSKYQSLLKAAQQRVAALAGEASDGTVKDASKLGTHTLTAPIAGTIVEARIARGELVEGDRIAFLISELRHLWVELDVFERSLSAVRVGDEVDLTALSEHGGVIRGRVAQVGAVIDPATRSAPVRIEIDDVERRLRPGQAVDASIKASGAAQAETLLVPTSAVTYVDGVSTVFVATDNHTVVPVKVELGADNGQDRQVLSGVSLGQQVVVQGVFELKSELFR